MACHEEGHSHSFSPLRDKLVQISKEIEAKSEDDHDHDHEGEEDHDDESTCENDQGHQGEEHKEIETAYESALEKLAKTLKRRKLGLEVLTSVKVWKISEQGDEDHHHGSDIWTKAVYQLNGKLKTTYIQCHQHDANSEYFCHYKKKSFKEAQVLISR